MTEMTKMRLANLAGAVFVWVLTVCVAVLICALTFAAVRGLVS